MYIKNHLITIVTILLLLSFNLLAQDKEPLSGTDKIITSGLDHEAAKTVQQFHLALRTQDRKSARAVLSDDVLIYESGNAERSAEEYAAGHMKADMKYLATISSELVEHQVKVTGDVAISTARFKNIRTVAGRSRESISMETIVVSKINNQWLITHIHWS